MNDKINTASQKQIKGFIVLVEIDLKRKYKISKHGVKLLQQIFFYQCGSKKKCIASKETLAKHTGISKRQLYNLLRQFRLKGLIVRGRREIRLSTSFLRYLMWLHSLYSSCQFWSEHYKVKLQWLWKKCGKSMIKLYKRIFGIKPLFTSTAKILHPNNRLKDILSFNMNNRTKIDTKKDKMTNLRQKIIEIIDSLSLEEVKEIYLRKVRQMKGLE
ncbi:MAG: hypothetical protein ABIK31_04460 [candidate division WOR-3 bacterium]